MSPTNPVKSYIQNLVADGNVKKALSSMRKYTDGVDDSISNQLLLLQSQYNRLTRDRMTMSASQYNIGIANITLSITQLLDDLPVVGNDISMGNQPTPQQPGNIPASPPQPEPPTENSKKKILFMKANPQDTVPLNLDGELRKVKNALESSTNRDNFELITEEAVQIPTITRALMKHKPDIVHFSGHGTGQEGIAVENAAGNVELFPTVGLDRLFKLFKKSTKCVVLNACYASEQAKVISEHGIYVTGMNNTVKDKAAGDFSLGFYQSLFEGEDYEFAFQIAMVNISSNLTDANTPELWLDGKIVE